MSDNQHRSVYLPIDRQEFLDWAAEVDTGFVAAGGFNSPSDVMTVDEAIVQLVKLRRTYGGKTKVRTEDVRSVIVNFTHGD